MLLAIILLIFLTVFCSVVGVFLAASSMKDSPRSELKRRLRQMARQGGQELPADLKGEIFREMEPLERYLENLPAVRRLESSLDRAGVKVSPSLFLGLCLGLGLLSGTLAAASLRTPVVFLPAAGGAVLLSLGFLKVKAQRRVDQFTELFPEALSMISRSLRAGHSFNTAVQLVGSEIPDPVGDLFKTAYDQQMLGLRMTDALNSLNHRIESLDLRFFTTIINVNSEIGGNLADILDKLSETIKERLRIRKQVRVFTAQGRMSGYVLGALPVVTFVIFGFLNPSYEANLIREPLGVYILILAVCMQIVGFLVIRNIIKIKI